jgi:hypothetical protein
MFQTTLSPAHARGWLIDDTNAFTLTSYNLDFGFIPAVTGNYGKSSSAMPFHKVLTIAG